MYRDGYAVVHGGVASSLVARAKAAINAALGRPGSMVAGGVQGTGKLAGDVQCSAPLIDLVLDRAGGALGLAEAFIGDGRVALPRGCQIALRFPEVDNTGCPHDGVAWLAEPGATLPGTEWHTDGMRKGRRNPFTLLLGVALSAQQVELCGNFTVFPGSHHRLHQLMISGGRLRGVDDSRTAPSKHGDGDGDGDGAAPVGDGYSVAVGASNPWCRGEGLPDLGTACQLQVLPGDVVLAHPKLAHRGGPNLSPDIRYMVYVFVLRAAACCQCCWLEFVVR